MKKKNTLLKLRESSKKKNRKNNDGVNNIYCDKEAKFLFVKYKKFNDEKAKTELISLTYPIIFSVLKKIGKKINTNNKIFNHEDLFNEGILIVHRCINNFDLKFNVKFSTFIWVSLYRGFFRFINSTMLRPEKYFSTLSNDNLNLEDLEYIENKEDKKRARVNSYLTNESLFVEKDLERNFTEIEKRIAYLKYKKYDAEEICHILNINSSKYYRLLNNIKKKFKE